MSLEELDVLTKLGALDAMSAEEEAENKLHESFDVALDDVSGEELCADKVRAARADELQSFSDMGVYEYFATQKYFA